MDKATLIGDIYENWKRHASDRQTVIFASGRRHALHILEQFTEKGERIAYVDGDTPEFERDEKLSRLASGALQLIVNVGILTEGWDCPSVSCVVLARITESCGLYLQMIGRILRTLAGEDGWPKERWHLRKKRDGIILDHGGNTIRHGFVTDEREYDLHGNHKRPKEDIAPITTCQKCFAVFSNLPACPACGGVNEGRQAATADRKDPEQKDGTLQEVNREEVRQAEIRFFHEKLAEQTHRGYKPGYAKKCFFDKFGRWPGKEIGVKTTWEEQRDEQGKRRFKPKGFKFQDIEVHVGG
jgi:superfamily II DNA or RNA helicase